MRAPFVITKCVCKCICVLTVGCHISSLRLFLSAKYLFGPFVSVILYRCVPAHIYNPQLYGVSKVVLNNAENLRLTTEQTQWGLSAQDILFCIVLCCTFLSSQIIYSNQATVWHETRTMVWFYQRTHEHEPLCK